MVQTPAGRVGDDDGGLDTWVIVLIVCKKCFENYDSTTFFHHRNRFLVALVAVCSFFQYSCLMLSFKSHVVSRSSSRFSSLLELSDWFGKTIQFKSAKHFHRFC